MDHINIDVDENASSLWAGSGPLPARKHGRGEQGASPGSAATGLESGQYAGAGSAGRERGWGTPGGAVAAMTCGLVVKKLGWPGWRLHVSSMASRAAPPPLRAALLTTIFTYFHSSLLV
ncbi:hypothetical protein KC19_VG081200 [Ceratodon purpureus]|uniref:Uncharacterized protein n=1 Tax=Ceratodon purpureus TaxID=3225 RepID=A0A8T0HN78_CERPU|nr:hypothetical protein KC19_VG081200 [Ceratodon purpureus]